MEGWGGAVWDAARRNRGTHTCGPIAFFISIILCSTIAREIAGAERIKGDHEGKNRNHFLRVAGVDNCGCGANRQGETGTSHGRGGARSYGAQSRARVCSRGGG